MLDTAQLLKGRETSLPVFAHSVLSRGLHGDLHLVAGHILATIVEIGGTVVEHMIDEDVHPFNRRHQIDAAFRLSGESENDPSIYSFDLDVNQVVVYLNDDEIFAGTIIQFYAQKGFCFPRLVDAHDIYGAMDVSDRKVRDLRSEIEDLEAHIEEMRERLALEEGHRSQLARAWADADENGMVLRP